MKLKHKIFRKFATLGLVTFEQRPSTKLFMEHFKNRKLLVGAEIGVQRGFNARSILKALPQISFYYLIDPYITYHNLGNWYGVRDNGDTTYSWLEIAEVVLEKFKNKIKFIRKMSEDAVDDIPMLDFLYIDGNHDYEFVKKDVNLYWNKIKVGGIMAGHDFNASCCGVRPAVVEFCKENGLQLDGSLYDWWIIKKEM